MRLIIFYQNKEKRKTTCALHASPSIYGHISICQKQRLSINVCLNTAGGPISLLVENNDANTALQTENVFIIP